MKGARIPVLERVLVVPVCFVLVGILMMATIIVDIFCDPALSGLDRAMWTLFSSLARS